MKAVIFGASGQDGVYLSRLLCKNNVETIGISRSKGDLKGDISDYKFVENIIQSEQPDYVFHFAANSTTRHTALFENHAAISTGTINLLESVYKHCRNCKVFLSGSAVQFENKGLPINENTPFAPLSPYAVSRIHSVYAGRYYRSLGLKVYVGYFFNHDSPLRTEQHINQKIALAAKRIAAGEEEIIEIGDIRTKKEFNFAGDFMEAVWCLVNQNDAFEAVIGSGKSHSIEDWLNLCFAHIDKNWQDYIRVKKNFTAEYDVLVSDPALLNSLGWRAETTIKDLAEMMME